MVIVLLVWAFTFFCLFGMGRLFAALIGGGRPGLQEHIHPFLLGFGGLILVTVIANCWNYFAPVGMVLNLLVFLVSSLVIVTRHKAVLDHVRHWAARWRAWGWPSRIGLFALLVIALVKSASPSELFDEGGYYLPYIRWIEHYRIIPGLANIEDRFGFNSAFHMASAFFGVQWLVPGGAYALNGAVFLLFGAWCIGALNRLLKPGKIVLMSDVMKLFCLFFLMRNMLTSTAADLSNMFLAEAVLILFVQKIEDRTVERADSLYYLIVAGTLFVTTIKLSSLLVVLIPAYLTIRILAAGQGLQWGRLVLLTALVVLPWLGRSPILSGYLVYPLYQVDLFDVDWKVPKGLAELQYFYVGEFAKTDADMVDSKELAQDRNAVQWVPAWFARENTLNKSMALAMGLSLLGLLTIGTVKFRRNLREHPDLMAFGSILMLGTVLWFLKNPAFRFGWSWGIILVAFSLYIVLQHIRMLKWLRWGALVLFMLTLALSTVKSVTEGADILPSALLKPAPLPEYGTTDALVGKLDVRIAPPNRCWGVLPPCITTDRVPMLEARGGSVEDGFRDKRH